MASVSTHVLDTSTGKPAAGVSVGLCRHGADRPIAQAVTDVDGRVAVLGPGGLEAGDYELRFGTAGYFAASGRRSFFPEVVVVFTIAPDAGHYHVPLLLSPFGYSTYRGT